MDHLPPPSFMTITTLTEAGTLPSKIIPPTTISQEAQHHPEAQPLLSATSRSTPPHTHHLHHHHPHWPPGQPLSGHQQQAQQEMRV